MDTADPEDATKSHGSHDDGEQAAPSSPNGTSNGTGARPDSAVAEPSTGAPNLALGQPDATARALDGEPGAASAPRWCRRCLAEVVPVGKGACPRCGAFLKLNFTARKHPINVLRRDALLAELVAEYQPSTRLLRSTCEHVAGTLEQLEVT